MVDNIVEIVIESELKEVDRQVHSEIKFLGVLLPPIAFGDIV